MLLSPKSARQIGLPQSVMAILAAVGLSSCEAQTPVGDAFDHDVITAALIAEMEIVLEEASFPGLTATVILPDGTLVSAAVGLADIENDTAMRSDHTMPAGSVGKSLVAATAMALVDEGALTLDTPIAHWIGERDWYQGMPNGDTVTLRMLLNHSSGIAFDYIPSDDILPLFIQTLGPDGVSMADQGFAYTDIARGMGQSEAEFAAGEGFRYSDSNYILAALLIEDVTGNLFYDEAVRRFTQPMGLDSLIPTPRASDTYAAGYEMDAEARMPGFPEKHTIDGRMFYDPSLEWAGGGFASNSADLAQWARQLYGRHGVPSAHVDEMIASVNVHLPIEAGWQYGLGIMVASDELGQRLMHAGYIPGYSAYIEYLPRYDMAIAIQINTRSGFGANRGYVTRMWASVLEAMDIDMSPSVE